MSDYVDHPWRYQGLFDYMDQTVAFRAQMLIDHAEEHSAVSRRSVNYFLKDLVAQDHLILARRGVYVLASAVETNPRAALAHIAALFQASGVRQIASFDSAVTPDKDHLAILLNAPRKAGGRVGPLETSVGNLHFHYVSDKLMTGINELPDELVYVPRSDHNLPIRQHTPEVGLALYAYHHWRNPVPLPSSALASVDLARLSAIVEASSISLGTINSILSDPITELPSTPPHLTTMRSANDRAPTTRTTEPSSPSL